MQHYELTCSYCGKGFTRPSNYKKRQKPFCSPSCTNKSRELKQLVHCRWCNREFKKKLAEIRRSKNHFCHKSCAASFNNTQKRKSRRSKCEIMLFDLIANYFIDLEIIPNDKSILDGYEIDIFIPSIKLGIEWNGIFHYKPIYGESKLNKIQSHDSIKQKIAADKGISLIIIPDLVSNPSYVNEVFHKLKQIIQQLKSE